MPPAPVVVQPECCLFEAPGEDSHKFMSRVCIIGLDCLTPQLLFDSFADSLPNFEALRAQSQWGLLESSMPPITAPAWACMVTGYDPGTLGLYGFRDRLDHSYENRRLASSMSFSKPTLWSRLSRAGHSCRVLGVPLSWPPKPLRGYLVTGPMTPSRREAHTYPPEFAAELHEKTGGFIFDIDGFRDLAPEDLNDKIVAMTEQRFDLAEAWVGQPDWDFFMMVDMGPDRMHHGLWQYAFSDHHGWQPDHPLSDAIRQYYERLDRRVGRLLALLSPDDIVLVVSDHGAQSMRGGIAINQWLIIIMSHWDRATLLVGNI